MPPNRIPNNTLNAAELRGGLERLPQELYDTIVDMVLSIDSKQDLVNPEGRTLRRMTPHTRPPPQMQINQELHASISIAYYSKSTFHFTELWVLLKWVKSLSRRSRNLLRDIRCLTSFRDMDFSNFRDSRMMEQIDRILYPYPYSPPTCGHVSEHLNKSVEILVSRKSNTYPCVDITTDPHRLWPERRRSRTALVRRTQTDPDHLGVDRAVVL